MKIAIYLLVFFSLSAFRSLSFGACFRGPISQHDRRYFTQANISGGGNSINLSTGSYICYGGYFSHCEVVYPFNGTLKKISNNRYHWEDRESGMLYEVKFYDSDPNKILLSHLRPGSSGEEILWRGCN